MVDKGYMTKEQAEALSGAEEEARKVQIAEQAAVKAAMVNGAEKDAFEPVVQAAANKAKEVNELVQPLA